ncbi:hypothetical protein H257_12112 [Aphanomyces astaci]|uniref:Uncharacterized protein n=1 Tax=Aphanomyces astaci TaxID=112090 RepID=W4G1D8_APHAT|nr:hypothetical protein H257_12112 [Aphanomyces astaci]ETV73076.1 hypothetical protein H257_12112 [Aphanomyces astaci]|eukprot:XP_009837525.1 hypothetical protein H257_12112 [Aphanomyces astaci]
MKLWNVIGFAGHKLGALTVVCDVDLLGGGTLHLAYYTDVKNSASLLHKILSNEVNVALINADTVVSLFQVHAAASRALLSVQNHSMTTNSPHSEHVFNLNQATQVLVCVFDDATALDTVGIDGMLKPVTSIENHTHLTPEHIQVLKKHYKIQDLELQVTTLSDAIVSRIATKNVNK